MLCTSSQGPILVRGITSAYEQRCSRASFKIEPVQNHWASSTFLDSKTTQLLETYSRSEQTKPFGGHQDHPPIRGVGYLNRFQGCLLPYINTGTVQEISEISCPGSDIPVQSSAFWSVYSTHGVHCSNKGVERIHQYLADWLVRARSHQVCLHHTQDLVKICQELGWLVNLEKSELDPKQVFDFVGYEFDFKAGRV